LRAAQLLAKAGQRGLHRVDLAALSDQYIGETEKNLRRLLEEADKAQAILFFDEADALFGKRTEVGDAHDRYANIDVSRLISQLDAFQGLAIIATARPTTLDPAILRRFRIAADFTPSSLA
jgi:SpoVK/Ycf46/Vps4 family AAA+-type ATPase